MRFYLILVAGALSSASPVYADDKITIAPPPAWVVPVSLPASIPPVSGPAQALVTDLQVKFDHDTIATYQHIAIRINTPQALTALGSVNIVWKPEFDSVSVGSVHIRRGAEIIDVLGRGQTFTTLRREPNLEHAAIDGRLTGSLQAEGLRVGDILEFDSTEVTRDPILVAKGAVATGNLRSAPVTRTHLRFLWPRTRNFHWASGSGIATGQSKLVDNQRELTFNIENAEALRPPEQAPQRYGRIANVALTEYADWGEVAAAMQPLYARAAVIAPGSALAGEAKAIAAASADPRARAFAALRLVQDRVRYFLIALGDGGYAPVSAEQTWTRRFGDCKAKTVVLLALLHELGIKAEPALVNTLSADGLEQTLPMPGAFNHVLVRAEIDGKIYWLDGTRDYDRNIDAIAVPRFKWALPVRASGSALEKLVPAALTAPLEEYRLKFDASKGIALPAPFTADYITRGDAGIALRVALANVPGGDLDRVQRAYWTKRYDFLTPDDVSSRYDEASGEFIMTVHGTAKMDWDNGDPAPSYEADGAGLGWRPDYKRAPDTDQSAPYATDDPFWRLDSETIILPNKGAGFTIRGKAVDESVAGNAFHRSLAIKDGVFTMQASRRTLAAEFPASAAPAAQVALRALADGRVFVMAPDDYGRTAAEKAALLAETPKTADDYLERAKVLKDDNKLVAAAKDVDSAMALRPDATSYLYRSWIRRVRGDLPGAIADGEKAAAMAPEDACAWEQLAYALNAAGKLPAAVGAFENVVKLDPQDIDHYSDLARLQLDAGDQNGAKATLAKSAIVDPDDADMLQIRAWIDHSEGRDKIALAAADRLIAKRPELAGPFALRGEILGGLGRRDDAMAMFDKSIAIEPTADAYRGRSYLQPNGLRLADAEKSVALAPADPLALMARANALLALDRRQAALADFDHAIRLSPDNPALLLGKRAVLASLGRRDEALAMINADVAAHPDDAQTLNNACYERATLKGDLQRALGECENSLKIQNSAATLDSRGFVKLLLGRYADAIADFDAALKLEPNLPTSLFCRGIAAKRLGRPGWEADIDAARQMSPDIDKLLAGSGVLP